MLQLLTYTLLSAVTVPSFGKVYEVYTRDHFHDLLMDAPIGLRPASVVAFYKDEPTCKANMAKLDFSDHNLPSVENLFLSKYELTTARKRVWHDYESHLNMTAPFDIESRMVSDDNCPLLMYLPASYANEIGDYYRTDPSVAKAVFWDASDASQWRQWLWRQLAVTVRIIFKQPFAVEVTVAPHSGRVSQSVAIAPDGTIAVETSDTAGEEKVVRLSALESHAEVAAFVGDEIFISSEPRITQPSNKGKMVKPTPDNQDTILKIFPQGELDGVTPDGMIKLFVKQFSDGRWGFDIGRRSEIQPSLIRRRHSTTCMTHTRNLVLPQVLPHWCGVGFKKIPMPPGFHDRLRRFYSNYYSELKQENWDHVGTQLNCIDVPSHLVSLDHNMRERDAIANDVIKPILEEWSGLKLQHTAFYGIREYSRGAVLRNHVDRVETHTVSTILQIGQTGVDEDWQLEVVGLDGRYYQITLAPGEMALYEGHVLIHGRPKPLNATVFTNAFCHFKPDGYDWTTSRAWGEAQSKEIMADLHIRLQDIYR